MTNSSIPDLTNITTFFSDGTIISFFFWAFAALFSLFYLLFAIIITKQTHVLNKSLNTQSNSNILFISSLHIPISAAFLIFSIIRFSMIFM